MQKKFQEGQNLTQL